jgi:hypothetical protein
LTRVTYRRTRTVQQVEEVTIDDGKQEPVQVSLWPSLVPDEPVALNVIDGDEAERMLDAANERELPAKEGSR